MAAAGLGGPVALIGVGLIGGSLGLALREAGIADIRGVDPADAAVEDALGRGAITRPCSDVADAVAGARVVVVCAPVGDIPEVVRVALRAA
ncbi:MAG: NAD(P)-binding domain-containing protein, partial [Miltoncostaeaceae bacterium]